MSDDGDENPFADLGEGLVDDADDQAAAADTADASADAASSGPSRPSRSDPIETPAFEWGQDMQHPIYCRDESWEAFEELMMDVRYRLERRMGVKNVEKRELHDALVRAADEDDLVAAVLAARDLDADDFE